MFNNNLEQLEELLAGGDAEDAFDNRAERFHRDGRSAGAWGQGDRVYKQSRVDSLLWAYRDVGYLYADLNPLGELYSETFTALNRIRASNYHQLTLEEFGLSKADLDTPFHAGGGIGRTLPLREILDYFRRVYCGDTGAEFLHIQNRRIREWIIRRLESADYAAPLSADERKTILEDLIRTENLEKFMNRTFIGQHRFSIEGAEAVVPALHYLTDHARSHGVEHIVIGTTHRGRLTILNRVLNKSPEEILYLFEPNFQAGAVGGSGDVKYHIGYESRHELADGSSIAVTLPANASHLESVDAVVEGKTRALQDAAGDRERRRVLPVLLHGEAGFSGQGVVAEVFNLSRLAGFTTGGTIHIVINNQIGFTTPARDAHSALNPTDIAKALPVPVFHVNGDHPEAVVRLIALALDFRQTFGSDVVVDVFSFRRHGHNEGDEPSFTHPRMYQLIAAHPPAADLYGKRCVSSGLVTEADIEHVAGEFTASLAEALKRERAHPPAASAPAPAADKAIKPVDTRIPPARLEKVMRGLTAVPGRFHLHEKLKGIIRTRETNFTEKGILDWSAAEAAAFGSLLEEGIPVRLTGEDVERGTFSQRHLVWWDTESPEKEHHVPLNHLNPDQALLDCHDSPLAEYSILGFEYGYATARERALVIWEAQFGDFCNGAQVIIDNYLASGKAKWGGANALTLLLPHGFEGQGPEHSSAHPERFLMLCAQGNLRVWNPTTPAQYFHLLRAQALDPDRKPLVVFTPKRLLRYARAVSPRAAFSERDGFPVLDDPEADGDARVLGFCSGKIYYDLERRREEEKLTGTAWIRVERLYPFPAPEIKPILEKYTRVEKILWIQEEPKNRGAWSFFREQFEDAFPERRLDYRGRPASTSPAAGSLRTHAAEQSALMESVLAAHKEAGS